jgi:hypothetical protein
VPVRRDHNDLDWTNPRPYTEKGPHGTEAEFLEKDTNVKRTLQSNGIYVIRDTSNKIVYVGKSVGGSSSIRDRLDAHRKEEKFLSEMRIENLSYEIYTGFGMQRTVLTDIETQYLEYLRRIDKFPKLNSISGSTRLVDTWSNVLKRLENEITEFIEYEFHHSEQINNLLSKTNYTDPFLLTTATIGTWLLFCRQGVILFKPKGLFKGIKSAYNEMSLNIPKNCELVKVCTYYNFKPNGHVKIRAGEVYLGQHRLSLPGGNLAPKLLKLIETLGEMSIANQI